MQTAIFSHSIFLTLSGKNFENLSKIKEPCSTQKSLKNESLGSKEVASRQMFSSLLFP